MDAAILEVERLLGRTLDPELAEAVSDDLDAVRQEWDVDKRAGRREAKRVATKIKKIVGATSGKRTESLRSAQTPPPLVRQEDAPTVEKVQSWLLAVAANNHDSVVAYRAKHLADGLRQPDDGLFLWLRDQLSQERGSSTGNFWHAYLEPFGALLSQRRHNPWDARTTERAWREGRGEVVPSISELGPAEALLVVVDDVIRAFPWTARQATWFVLAGAIPWVEQIRTTLVAHYAEVAGCHRIEMSIDPGVDPAEVASAYRSARRSLRPSGQRATREITEKKLHLAWLELARQYRGAPRPTNREQMNTWNAWVKEHHPDKVKFTEGGKTQSWLYTVDTNFARDRNDVLARVQRTRANPELVLNPDAAVGGE